MRQCLVGIWDRALVRRYIYVCRRGVTRIRGTLGKDEWRENVPGICAYPCDTLRFRFISLNSVSPLHLLPVLLEKLLMTGYYGSALGTDTSYPRGRGFTQVNIR